MAATYRDPCVVTWASGGQFVIKQTPAFQSLTTYLPDQTVDAIGRARELFLNGAAYYEFGVYQGYNLYAAWTAGQEISNRIRYHGFDSFKGMPKNDVYSPEWDEGRYAVSRRQVRKKLTSVGVSERRVRLHQGWFSREYFDRLLISSELQFMPAAVAVVDCDIYDSAVPVLGFLRDLITVGTVILFDDWHCPGEGERRAWEEFLEKTPCKYDECDYGSFSHEVVIREIDGPQPKETTNAE